MTADKCENAVYIKAGFVVPCGRCPACLRSRKSQWTLRLSHEAEYYPDTTCFLTLTYDPAHLPRNKGIVTLRKRDYELFFKRFRKHFKGKEIKYYICGEYGTSGTYRPHYHAIVYGVGMKDLDTYEVHTLDAKGRPVIRIASKVVDKTWQLGFASVSAATEARMAYVAGYVQKKLFKKEALAAYFPVYGTIEKGKRKGKKGIVDYLRLPPFAHQSHGIGKRYALKHADQFKADKFVRAGKYHHPIPRYYRKILDIGQEAYRPYIREHAMSKVLKFEESRKGWSCPEREHIETVSPWRAMYHRNVINEPAAMDFATFRCRYMQAIIDSGDPLVESESTFVQAVYMSPFYDHVLDCFYSPSYLNYQKNRARRYNNDLRFKYSLKEVYDSVV